MAFLWALVVLVYTFGAQRLEQPIEQCADQQDLPVLQGGVPVDVEPMKRM